MKEFNKVLVIIGMLFFGFTSCEKDVVVIDAFDFNIEVIHQEIATINYPQETKLSIVPEKLLESDRYFFSYVLLEGEGAYIIDGAPVSQAEHIEIEDIEEVIDANFVSSSLGIKKVRIEINNNGKVIKTIDLIYDVRHNPYSLTMTSPISEYVENQVIPIKVNLQNVGVDDEVLYKRAFFLLEGEGVLTAVGDTDPTPLEQYLPIEQGESNYSLLMSTLGNAKFLIRTMDSNGQIKEAMLEFTGFSPNLAFTVVTNPTNLFVNSNFDFDFVIPPTAGMFEKSIRYEIITPVGAMLNVANDDGFIIENQLVVAPDSGIFSWSGLSNVVQDVLVRFYLTSNGEEISQDLILSFQQGSLFFDAIPESIDAMVNEEIIINGEITETGTASPPYRIRFVTDKIGALKYNGVTYASGAEFPVGTDLIPEMTYEGQEAGTHALSFTVFNAADQSSNTLTFNMDFN